MERYFISSTMVQLQDKKFTSYTATLEDYLNFFL